MAMAMADRSELLKVQDAATRLGISRSAMYVLIAHGEVEMVPVYGRTRRVLASSLEAYVERKRREAS